MFLFLLPVFASYFPISNTESVEIFRDLKQNTVLLSKTTLFHRPNESSAWIEVDSQPCVTSLEVYASEDKNTIPTGEKHQQVSNYKKYSPSSVFFFTAPSSTYYTLKFNILSTMKGEYAIKLNVFEGYSSNPQIMSGVDYQINWLSGKMTDLLDFAKTHFDEEEDDLEYVSMFGFIFTLLYSVVFLKFFVLIVTLFVFNGMTKQFFVKQRITK